MSNDIDLGELRLKVQELAGDLGEPEFPGLPHFLEVTAASTFVTKGLRIYLHETSSHQGDHRHQGVYSRDSHSPTSSNCHNPGGYGLLRGMGP